MGNVKSGGAAIPGMAHLPGTGPVVAHCVMCLHWQHGRPRAWRIHSKTAVPGKAECAQFARMMRKPGPAVPAFSPACKYYKEL